MIPYIDIHTHRPCRQNDEILELENIMVSPTDPFNPVHWCSIGIHPWYIREESLELEIQILKYNSHNNRVICIGECGLDKRYGAPWDIQKKVFQIHIEISEEVKKPLIIHCVKAIDEIIHLHNEMKPEMPWILHRFQGHRELIRQLALKNFYFSLWQTDQIRANDLAPYLQKRIFFETDDADRDIKEIYSKASESFGLSLNELKQIVYNNFVNLIGKDGMVISD